MKRLNPVVAQMTYDRQKREEYTHIAMQMALDAACFAAHEVFGMGAGRAQAFYTAFRAAAHEIAKTLNQDTADIEYSKSHIDEGLKAIVGAENFAPWEERYAQRSH